MKCCKCGSSIEKNINFYPVQPRGTNHRKWECEECLLEIPKRKRDKLLKAGLRKSMRLRLKIKKNQIIDILKRCRDMIKLIRKILEAHLELLVEELQEYEKLHSKDGFNIIAGRAIEEISYLYPASYEDAVIIYEEWCKGLLSECRPDGLRLREYAKYVGDPDRYKQWAEKYNKKKTEFEGGIH